MYFCSRFLVNNSELKSGDFSLNSTNLDFITDRFPDFEQNKRPSLLTLFRYKLSIPEDQLKLKG